MMKHFKLPVLPADTSNPQVELGSASRNTGTINDWTAANMRAWKLAGLLVVFATASLATPGARADFAPYQGVVDLEAKGNDFIVRHHHDWSWKTKASREKMILTHQDPFNEDNDYAYVAWYARSNGARLQRMPGPALTWLGVSPDSRYVIGLSNIMLDNPYQLVVYNRKGELLLKRHIGSEVACLTPGTYQEFRRSHSRQFDMLNERVWMSNGVVYVDYLTMDMPRRLGPLWQALYPFDCPSPFSPNFSETVTNHVYWYNDADPAPVIVENAGQPSAIRLKDPKGVLFTMPFRLQKPSQ